MGAGICMESESECPTLEKSSGTLSISSYDTVPYSPCTLLSEQFSELLNDDMADVGCSESKNKLDEHHIFINRLIFKHQELAASVEELKAGHKDLCSCSENRGHVVSQLAADSEVQYTLSMHRFEKMDTELNTLSHDFNELSKHVETLKEGFMSQRIEHTSLTASCDVWHESVRKEFKTLVHDTDEVCRSMKSLEEDFDAKSNEHSLFMRDCQARDEMHARTLDDIRSSLRKELSSLDSNTDKLCRQVMSWEELFHVKIAECNAKLESYHNEFLYSQQQVRNSCEGQNVWCEHHSNDFPDAQFGEPSLLHEGNCNQRELMLDSGRQLWQRFIEAEGASLSREMLELSQTLIRQLTAASTHERKQCSRK